MIDSDVICNVHDNKDDYSDGNENDNDDDYNAGNKDDYNGPSNKDDTPNHRGGRQASQGSKEQLQETEILILDQLCRLQD